MVKFGTMVKNRNRHIFVELKKSDKTFKFDKIFELRKLGLKIQNSTKIVDLYQERRK